MSRALPNPAAMLLEDRGHPDPPGTGEDPGAVRVAIRHFASGSGAQVIDFTCSMCGKKVTAAEIVLPDGYRRSIWVG